MGLLELKRLMHEQRERRRRRQIQARCQWIASGNKRKGSPSEQDCVDDGSICSRYERKGSHCQQDCVADGSVAPCQQDCSTKSCQDGPNLPEDIWCNIHSLMPLRDAARAACVSRAFRCSWKCYPNLIFSIKTLGLNGYMHGNYSLARVFTSKVDHILKNHSGDGIKSLELLEAPNYRAKDRYHLDSWLEKAVTPVLEELRLHVYSENDKYEFPCSLLSHGNADSIRFLRLSNCTFRPTVGLGCLTVLNLFMVRITGDELGTLLSSSFALERLQLRTCERIRCLMIPCHVPSLSYLEVLYCSKLRLIESRAPNLTLLNFQGNFQVQLSLGAATQMKNIYMRCPGAICFSHAKLASSMPNLQSLVILSSYEKVGTPVSSKFLHLKYLNISINGLKFSLSYDYFSLASFFDASPSLETFILDVWQERMEHVPVFDHPSEPRQIPEHNHDKLRNVRIYGFSSVKSLVELTCHILGTATALQWLILDTQAWHGLPDCSVNKTGKCFSMLRENILEAHRALLAVQTYIKPKVPSTVNFHVLGPCSRCHV